MALSNKQQEFLSNIWPHAQLASAATGIDASIIAAQAALETGWGSSAPNNNYFGIKGPGGLQTTKEFLNGAWVTIKDSFKGYASLGDSVAGYADFINKNPRYGTLKSSQGRAAQLDALQKSGYATDPNYSKKVGSIASTIDGWVGQANSVGQSVITNTASTASKVGDFAKSTIGSIINGAVASVTGTGANGSNSGSNNGDKKDDGGGILGFLKRLFSINTGSRMVAVVVGIVLIAGAIWALVNSDKVIAQSA